MKYLVAGLGNFGIEYVGTRHNIGFDVLDHLAREKEVAFESKRLADYCEIKHRGRNFHLIKPTTYMNRSGRSVTYWLDKLKLDIHRLLVIVDDVALPLGKLRLRLKGSDGGHNGLYDIQTELGTTKYPRLRFGIGSEFPRGRQVDFVLGNWTEEEERVVRERIPNAAEAALIWGIQGAGRAMDTINSAEK